MQQFNDTLFIYYVFVVVCPVVGVYKKVVAIPDDEASLLGSGKDGRGSGAEGSAEATIGNSRVQVTVAIAVTDANGIMHRHSIICMIIICCNRLVNTWWISHTTLESSTISSRTICARR